MGNQLKKLTTLPTNNNMFKSFTSAIALLAIGAYASEHEKLTSAGGFYTKETYKYGRFIANMKASNALGTGSAFFLYRFESFPYDVFEEWNSMAIVPSLGQNEEGSTLYTKMSRYHLDEHWDSYDKFTLDDEYHKYEIEWTPKYLAYKIDGVEIRRKEGVDGLDREQNLAMTILQLPGEEGEAGEGFDASEMPYYTDVDYVEVYRHESNGEFKLNFRGDFDSYNERWAAVDNITWPGKCSTYKKENAYVKNSHLQLKLDKNPDYQGYDDGEHSGDDSHDDEDFHVLPAPKDGTLDAAIEKATRVGVVMVRQYLEHFSSSMSHVLQ